MPVTLVDRSGKAALFNELGELQVAEGDFDLTKFIELAEPATAYNFYLPLIGKQFVITGILAFADKDVLDSSDTTITIYEASTPAATTADRIIVEYGMGRLSVLPYPNVRLLASEGVYINAKTDDDDIHLNLIGHFIPTILKNVGNAPGVA